jgi:hypothetical protein
MTEDRNMVATRLLMENDKVKIWEMRLQPGERGELHSHKYDHVLVQISGDRMAVEPDPSTKSVYKDYVEAPVEPGKIFFIEKGGVETAYNVGKEPFYEIVIELKE